MNAQGHVRLAFVGFLVLAYAACTEPAAAVDAL